MAEQIALALINGKISQIAASDTIRGAGGSFSTFRCVMFYDSNQQIPAVSENLFEAVVSGGEIELNTLSELVI